MYEIVKCERQIGVVPLVTPLEHNMPLKYRFLVTNGSLTGLELFCTELFELLFKRCLKGVTGIALAACAAVFH